MIGDSLRIREDQQSVGTFEFSGPSISDIVEGKMTYHDQEVKIKNKPTVMGNALWFNERTYQFLDKEVRELPSKKKLMVVKHEDSRLFFETPNKERVLKVKIIEDIIKFDFIEDPPDFILYLIAGIFYFFKIIILGEMMDASRNQAKSR